jgi:hypothetical protein
MVALPSTYGARERCAVVPKTKAQATCRRSPPPRRHRHLPGPQLRHPEDRDLGRRHRPGRRHAERPRAGGAELSDRPRHPLPDRPRRAPDRGHLAVPLQGRLLAARPGDHVRDRRGRHGAVGHQGQGRRPAALPAAGRRLPRPACMVYGHANGETIEETIAEAREYVEQGYKAVRLQTGVPGMKIHLRRLQGQVLLRAGRRRPADRDVWSTEKYLRVVPELFAGARGAGLGRPSAARRPPPADADRGRRGWARTWSPIARSGSRTRPRPRTRPASA